MEIRRRFCVDLGNWWDSIVRVINMEHPSFFFHFLRVGRLLSDVFYATDEDGGRNGISIGPFRPTLRFQPVHRRTEPRLLIRRRSPRRRCLGLLSAVSGLAVWSVAAESEPLVRSVARFVVSDARRRIQRRRKHRRPIDVRSLCAKVENRSNQWRPS